MALTVYTRDQLRDILLDHIRARITGANVAFGSDYYWLAVAIATIVHGDQSAASYLVKQILPSTSERAFLDAHAALRRIDRLPATKSVGKILVTATALTSITSGLALTHAGGGIYTVTATTAAALATWSGKTTAPGTTASRIIVNPDASSIAVDDVLTITGYAASAVRAVLPDAGTAIALDLYDVLSSAPSAGTAITPTAGVVVSVQASAVGSAGNLAVGDELPFDSAPAGVSGTPVVLEMSGGGESETDEELRLRVLDWLAERPGAGNRSDYRQWSRETSGVRLADAFVYPSYRGLGTADVVPFGVSGARQTGTAVNALVTAQLATKKSFIDDALVRQLDETTTVAVDVSIQCGTGYEPDFVTAVAAHGTQADVDKVRLTAAPDEIEIGDRVLVKAGTARPRLYQRTVVGKESSPDKIVLDEDLPSVPEASSTVYPGGPLAQPLIDAISTMMDDLGPGDTDPATRFPAPAEAHPDELPLARIYATCMGVTGVRDAAITAPATDQTPASLVRLALGAFTIRMTTASV